MSRPATNRGERSKNRGTDLATDQRRLDAVRLRRLRFSFREIGEKLGVSHTTAHDYVRDEWNSVKEHTFEEREKLLAQELEDLDALHQKWMPLAVHQSLDVTKETSRGTISMDDFEAGAKAAGIILSVSARRAKLLGLDAPEKHEHEVRTPMTRAEFKSRFGLEKKTQPNP